MSGVLGTTSLDLFLVFFIPLPHLGHLRELQLIPRILIDALNWLNLFKSLLPIIIFVFVEKFEGVLNNPLLTNWFWECS